MVRDEFNMLKAWMGGHIGIVVGCSILADLGTEFSSLEPRLFVHPHRVFISPSTPTCLAYYVKPLVRVFHLRVR